jgi:thiol-disulfide isomerase/thioredoxin
MLITWLTTAALSFPSSAATPSPSLGEGHGKIAWFQGSFQDALAEAKASKKLVFIDFWTTWCGWCKRLDKDTFSNADVAEVMKGFVCLSIDAESTTGRPVAAKFPIHGFPALFFVAPDGTVEDMIGGYKPPADFKKEAERILAGQGTLGALRRAVEADPSSVDKRFKLAQKMEQVGDGDGRDAQMAEIRKLDPAGKSLPMRQLALGEVLSKINQQFQKDQSLDVDAVATFLASESHPEILFQGNYALVQMHDYLAQQATGKGDLASAKQHRDAARASMKTAWANVPEEQVAAYGNTVAWAFYEQRDELSPADKAFALEVAEKASATAKDDAHAIDTYACCLFMNGKKDEALKQLDRCRELDPKAAFWRDRLAEFQK